MTEFKLPKPIMTYEQWSKNIAVCIEQGELPEVSNDESKRYAIYVIKRGNRKVQLGIEFTGKDGESVSVEYVHILGCTFDQSSNWGVGNSPCEIFDDSKCRYWEVDLTSTAQILALVEEIHECIARMKNRDLQEYLTSCVS
jgi:formylmethanofuran dehydrogenase subunit B